MHQYRTHTCGELNEAQAGTTVRLSGWVHRKRDHGNLVFVDLRDHYGITQTVIDIDNPMFQTIEDLKNESVVTITGTVVKREASTVNTAMSTGLIEVRVESATVLSKAEMLPLQVNSNADFPEETRLKYRYLDLRREKQHANIVLRSQVIASIRRRMIESGFLEMQTPILTSSSPEGARDYLVPSRIHPGHFYALPQAPQIFKQLFMVAGFDRYFQIAPCFRDEDARADRSPGEFYQLDMEMSFVTQEDVFSIIEPVLTGTFKEFTNSFVTEGPYPRITYADSLLKYGNDKPDLRNPIIITDVTEVFDGSEFSVFAGLIEKGATVRAIPAPGAADRPRSFFDKLNNWSREVGMAGLGYITFSEGEAKGPIAKFLDAGRLDTLKTLTGVKDGDSIFFVCGREAEACKFAGLARTRVGEELDIIAKDKYLFCWIVDFPMFEKDEETGLIDFSHNPFSMPQGGLDSLENLHPLEIKAYQYDIVCNGIELCSGAIRNHRPDIMEKAFNLVGYTREDMELKFSHLLHAFKYGAPPHGGCAPGIDRIVMLLANEPNIREVVAFPMNQQAQDLMMQAPAKVPEKHLKELYLEIKLPPEKKKGS